MSKQVVNSKQVAHLWVHKAQASARNNGGSLFFQGDTIYSYGDHFPMARHVSNGKQDAILYTTQSYSITTSKHLSFVRRAIPSGVTVFHVSDVTTDRHGEHLKEYQTRVNELAQQVSRAKSNKDWKLESLKELVKEANDFAEFFNLKSRVIAPSNEWLKAEEKSARERAAKERKEREAKKERERLYWIEKQGEQKLQFNAWLIDGDADERTPFPQAYNKQYTGTHYLRIKGDNVQTSGGAEVPIEHVQRIARIVVAYIEKGETYQRNGHTIHIGHFQLDRIDKDGTVFIGCHVFNKGEVLRFAKVLTERGEL